MFPSSLVPLPLCPPLPLPLCPPLPLFLCPLVPLSIFPIYLSLFPTIVVVVLVVLSYKMMALFFLLIFINIYLDALATAQRAALLAEVLQSRSSAFFVVGGDGNRLLG